MALASLASCRLDHQHVDMQMRELGFGWGPTAAVMLLMALV